MILEEREYKSVCVSVCLCVCTHARVRMFERKEEVGRSRDQKARGYLHFREI